IIRTTGGTRSCRAQQATHQNHFPAGMNKVTGLLRSPPSQDDVASARRIRTLTGKDTLVNATTGATALPRPRLMRHVDSLALSLGMALVRWSRRHHRRPLTAAEVTALRRERTELRDREQHRRLQGLRR
ncbi:hypothetical protein B0H03_1131, partial [Rathayibacter iranicus NCPPB 2253 = VKM Ac-1602]